MPPITHEIDPDADTVITLRNASAIFAPWIDESERPKPTEDTEQVTMDDLRKLSSGDLPSTKKSKRDLRQSRVRAESSSAGEYISVTLQPQNSQIYTAEDGIDLGANGDMEVDTTNGGAHPLTSVADQDLEEIEDIHFRVSSRHLMLASPWFKRSLSREGWAESSRTEEDGLFHIFADDWDAEAFQILLNIFHLRNRHVPRAVKLDMFGKIAMLVDYYECGEAIELFTDMWIEPLKIDTPIPSNYCRELIIWIWISWVFDLSDIFHRATTTAIRQTEKTMHTLELPIPHRVSGNLSICT